MHGTGRSGREHEILRLREECTARRLVEFISGSSGKKLGIPGTKCFDQSYRPCYRPRGNFMLDHFRQCLAGPLRG